MAKKNTFNYFDAFAKNAEFCIQAAAFLQEVVENFNNEDMAIAVKKMHVIEHSADVEKHALTNCLMRDFLPPIEREDIISLAQNIDDITDTIEETLGYIDMYGVTELMPELRQFMEMMMTCTKTVYELLVEFKNFRSSKKSATLNDKIILINNMEEDGDRLYTEAMKSLFRTCKDPIKLMIWSKLFDCFEHCFDTCEHVADVVEEIILKNT